MSLLCFFQLRKMCVHLLDIDEGPGAVVAGKCVFTFLTLMRGQVLWLPCQIADSQVHFVGKPAAAWRYQIACSMLGSS